MTNSAAATEAMESNTNTNEKNDHTHTKKNRNDTLPNLAEKCNDDRPRRTVEPGNNISSSSATTRSRRYHGKLCHASQRRKRSFGWKTWSLPLQTPSKAPLARSVPAITTTASTSTTGSTAPRASSLAVLVLVLWQEGILAEFVPKLVLEVWGGAGAIWGFSEACGLRRPSTQWFWRPVALSLGFVFFLRFLQQVQRAIKTQTRNLPQQQQQQQEALQSALYDLDLGVSTSPTGLTMMMNMDCVDCGTKPPPLDNQGLVPATKNENEAPSTCTTTYCGSMGGDSASSSTTGGGGDGDGAYPSYNHTGPQVRPMSTLRFDHPEDSLLSQRDCRKKKKTNGGNSNGSVQEQEQCLPTRPKQPQ